MGHRIATRRYSLLFILPLIVAGAADLRQARAEPVPYSCEMLPDRQTVRIVLSNPAARERSCIASCRFQTPLNGREVQIICTHPVASGASDIEMCVKDSGGEELTAQTSGSADCSNF